jgi:7,8-dihydro-6-hydroxymethylpterin dimethyltransferase
MCSTEFSLSTYKPVSSFTPKWSDVPLLKSWAKTKPPLGWPRTTDSLCPECVREARQKILAGEVPWQVLLHEKVGEIKANIIERDGQVWMIKECPRHGKIEDLMAIDSRFLAWIEKNFPGRDLPAHNDNELHNHGSSSIRHGRGSVLTIDLTNRCNMMCDPCFMDANQVGFVHELSWKEIKEILDNATKIKPKRQIVIQFSGGEPTLSPHLIKAIRYAHEIGYNTVQVATNGIRFGQSKEFAKEAADAGLQYAYLQFDGISNEANSHRKVGNLFEVKLQAIANLHEAGVGIQLVTTLINGVNNDQVGPIIRFARDNPEILFVAFQPVSFTGRDEDVTPERRLRQRYTLSHLAHDVKEQTGVSEPLRDWFPLSLLGPFADFFDHVNGPQADWGRASCGCHPNCGVATAFMINGETKEMVAIPEFIDIPGLAADTGSITDAGRGKWFSRFMFAAALLKNYRPFKAPASLTLLDILRALDNGFEVTSKTYGQNVQRRKACWNYLLIGGMWFQDLFNYDFRRTEMCVIPYATQQGEISFCAYNTGVGWRKIIENLYKNATVAEWYRKYGRHKIYAADKHVELETYEHSLQVNAEDASRERRLSRNRRAKAAETGCQRSGPSETDL